ncbi:MAG: hypothetical protein HY348_09560, partial [Nitrospira defluvii]|nr:hypothetical protein [Nitrospira defluvii]
ELAKDVGLERAEEYAQDVYEGVRKPSALGDEKSSLGKTQELLEESAARLGFVLLVKNASLTCPARAGEIRKSRQLFQEALDIRKPSTDYAEELKKRVTELNDKVKTLTPDRFMSTLKTIGAEVNLLKEVANHHPEYIADKIKELETIMNGSPSLSEFKKVMEDLLFLQKREKARVQPSQSRFAFFSSTADDLACLGRNH